MKGNSRCLIAQEQLLDLIRSGNRDSSGKQLFALANVACEHRFAHQPKVESRIVAEDLPIEGRIAIEGCDREAEPACIEVEGALHVCNEELRLDGIEDRAWHRLFGYMSHGVCS